MAIKKNMVLLFSKDIYPTESPECSVHQTLFKTFGKMTVVRVNVFHLALLSMGSGIYPASALIPGSFPLRPGNLKCLLQLASAAANTFKINHLGKSPRSS